MVDGTHSMPKLQVFRQQLVRVCVTVIDTRTTKLTTSSDGHSTSDRHITEFTFTLECRQSLSSVQLL